MVKATREGQNFEWGCLLAPGTPWQRKEQDNGNSIPATLGIGTMVVGTTTIRTTTTQVGFVSSTIEKMAESREFVSFDEVQRAYFDCRKNKKRKPSAIAYEMNYEINNYNLWKELNAGTYEIGTSICFCVTRPKLREVFAADFRDRIVHHLLMNRMLPIFEATFHPDTYNCRVGKGVLYGVNRVAEQAKEIGKDCCYLRTDVSAFFMSIDKETLWESVEKLLREKWVGNDIDWWLALLKKVIMHRPERKCVRRGNIKLWDKLPKSKSLFYSNGKGLPIGNLTSQILANYYMNPIDVWLSGCVQGYGRYVNDIVLLNADKKKMMRLIPEIRKRFTGLGLSLNEKKIASQRADKGIPFTGYVIKPWGLYPARRMRNNAIAVAKTQEDAEHHLCRLNSYLGFLRHALTFGLRWLIWKETQKVMKGVYGTEKLYSIHKYKTKTI